MYTVILTCFAFIICNLKFYDTVLFYGTKYCSGTILCHIPLNYHSSDTIFHYSFALYCSSNWDLRTGVCFCLFPFFVSLYSPYMWDHSVFVFIFLIYLTYHSYWCKRQYFYFLLWLNSISFCIQKQCIIFLQYLCIKMSLDT